ncbi:MFS transporter [Streptomyces boninensis]|uniref:MFS transporter n=1 Tax=Streptomyces boninensis TaxID=2039455 RepID=UPI003B2120F3
MTKWRPLLAVCLGTFMLLLDITIVVVALPDMGHALGASLSDLQWVIDIYALALAAVLMGAGAMADVVGRRKMYLLGTALFSLASLACGLATNPAMLVAARGIQGIGAGAMFATTLSLLGATYSGRDRSIALGTWGAVSGAAAALGPILGGLLTQGIGWRWIFYVNLPLSAAAIALTLLAVRENKGTGRRIDWPGTATFAVFASATAYAVLRAGALGWTSAEPRTAAVLAAAALLAFILIERRAPHPMLDLALFRRPAFVGFMLGALALNAAAFGVLPYTSIWLQTLLGLSPVRGGLVLIPLAAAAFVTAAAGSRALDRLPQRWVIGGGLLLIGTGALAQATLSGTSGWPALTTGLILTGIGVGMVNPSVAGAALAAVPPQQAGMASGAVNTFRQLGYAFGVAIFGTLTTNRMASALTGKAPDPDAASHALAGGGAAGLHLPEPVLRSAFAAGLNTANVVAGSVALAAGVAVLLLVRPSASRDARERVATAAGKAPSSTPHAQPPRPARETPRPPSPGSPGA